MIRKAQLQDQATIINLAQQFYESTNTIIPFSTTMAVAQFRACLTNRDFVCFVLVKDSCIVGFLAAQCGRLHFSNVKVAQEIAWFVDPCHRGVESLKMLQCYEEWAKERNCQFIGMVGLGYDPVTQNLYKRRGYTAQERHFVKPLL